MALEDDVRFLMQVPTLSVLGNDAVRILAIGADSQYFPAGTILFHAGDIGDCGYVVQDGAIALEAAGGDGRDAFVAGPATLIGETALIADTARPATATVIEAATVLRIPRGLFLKMLEGSPDAAIRLRNALAARAEKTLQDLGRVQSMLAGAQGKR